jgi:hypothetical protein
MRKFLFLIILAIFSTLSLVFLAKIDSAQASCDYQVSYEECTEKQEVKIVCKTCEGFSWGFITDCEKCGTETIKKV